jgi:hypothetical protein
MSMQRNSLRGFMLFAACLVSMRLIKRVIDDILAWVFELFDNNGAGIDTFNGMNKSG